MFLFHDKSKFKLKATLLLCGEIYVHENDHIRSQPLVRHCSTSAVRVFTPLKRVTYFTPIQDGSSDF